MHLITFSSRRTISTRRICFPVSKSTTFHFLDTPTFTFQRSVVSSISDKRCKLVHAIVVYTYRYRTIIMTQYRELIKEETLKRRRHRMISKI
ncbi:hypothetical protein AQUCO_01100055v1 [Aquilegia coerulea]|uniref:Uncharacterized protein n=1 Tax=Aquilegia coerulea TaxID=218851 RepID=A0A2G5E5B8_AQUCA|nr:hypothetical protein AQUCO_01100055v1 [Aquilegia coerulea]